MTDRRYGTGNKYGNGRLYGASDVPIVNDRFRWGVDVGWSSRYATNNEADYMTGLYIFRGRRNFLNPNGQGFAPVETGRARVTLDNSDGRYDSWNTASPLYPYVEPGKNIRIRVRDLETGTVYERFTGVIVDIETVGYGADAKVVLVCEDGWYYLRNDVARVFSVREDFAIDRILGMVFGLEYNGFVPPFQYPFGTNFDTATDAIPYWWSSDSTLIADMVHDLTQSFFGKFFVAADGRATFYDRANARTSVATYTQSQMLKDIGNAQPWFNQRNSLMIRTHPRAEASNQVVWEQNTPLFVPNGETVNTDDVFTYNGQRVPVITPVSVATTGYLMNTQEDGLGTNLTSLFISTQNNGYRGDTIAKKLINNSGVDGYVTFFEWTGIPVYETGASGVSYPTMKNTVNREMVIDSIWHQDVNTANEIVQNYGPQVTAVRQFPMIQFDTRAEALTPDLFDIVTVSMAKLGVSSTDFEVGGIELETTNETCQAFTVRQYLEPHFTA